MNKYIPDSCGTVTIRNQIKRRIGKLISSERLAAGVTYEEAKMNLDISKLELQSWEAGFTSPECYRAFALFSYFGPQAVERATDLMNEILLERSRSRAHEEQGNCS